MTEQTPTPIKDIDAETLKLIRQRLGLSLRGMAAEIDHNKGTLSRYETGQAPIPRKTVLAIMGFCSLRGVPF